MNYVSDLCTIDGVESNMKMSLKGLECDNLKTHSGGQGHETAFEEDGTKKMHILVLTTMVYVFLLPLLYTQRSAFPYILDKCLKGLGLKGHQIFCLPAAPCLPGLVPSGTWAASC